MRYAFLLSKENVELAKEEALALLRPTNHKLAGSLLLINSEALDQKLVERLAYTRRAYYVLFSAKNSRLISAIKGYDWQKVYRNNFSVRIRYLSGNKAGYSEAELAGYVWRSLKHPKVNLADSATQIELLFTEERVFCCLLLKELQKGFGSRRAHLRPGFSPVSLNPKLARGLVNLTGIRKGSVVDPFCGTGGILIEAGLMGVKAVGSDIDPAAVKRCKANLDFYGIKNCSLKTVDALEMKENISYLATDLPYGRNTSVVGGLEHLYLSFLRLLKKHLKKRAVVVFPGFTDYKKLITSSGLNIKKEFEVYVHKSLTKRVVLLVP